ncbi:MAG: ABC transporter permease, partial [Anaerolineales bacterium]|nr:ABC transporter permease [Anaerolineales bacterium]
MTTFLIRRLYQAIPLLLIISVFSFLIIHLAPGDPVAFYVNPQKGQLPIEKLEEIRHQMGLDRPIHIQYLSWLRSILKGDWGYSFATKNPVKDDILEHLPNTLILGGSALLIAIIVSIPIGSLSAIKQYSFFDYLTTIGAFIGISIPSFWFGLVVIQIFSKQLGWLPSIGMHSLREELEGWAATV